MLPRVCHDCAQLEVEKLRTLVRTHTSEMEQRDRDEQTQFKRELEHLQTQLRVAQDELLQERRERIHEKQRELDERLQRSMATGIAQASGNAALAGTAVVDGVSEPARPPLESVQHLDMSSFLNTSTELPDRIKRIMDEWKKRMEESIAGSVQSISDQAIATAAVAAESSRGPNQPSAPALKVDEDTRSSDEEASAHTNAVRRPRSRSRRRRSSVHLDAVPSVTRVPFDKYLSLATESEHESESEHTVSRREAHAATMFERTRRMASRRDREHRHQDESSARRYHRSRQSPREPMRNYHSQHLRDDASDASEYDSEDGEQHFHIGHSCRTKAHRRHVQNLSGIEDNGHDEDDDDAYEDDDDAEHEDDADGLQPSDDDDAESQSNSHPPFVLLNELEGGRRPGTSASFSSLYESSLFDVVNAIEDAVADALMRNPAHSSAPLPPFSQSEPSRIASASSANELREQDSDQVRRNESESRLDTEASPAFARLTTMLHGIQARERKLARFAQRDQDSAQRSHSHSSHRNAASEHIDPDTRVSDVDAELALFDQVKDEYATELFATRQQLQRRRKSTDWRVRESAFELDRSLGPALSPQDLSVRDAIEHDMAELLRHDTSFLHTQL